MTVSKQVTMAGTGGQGIILAGTTLGHAGINDGKWVASASSYGVQARGGYARTGVVLSDEPISFPHVIKADVFMAMSQEAYDAFADKIAANGVVIYDGGLVSPKDIPGLRQVGILATDKATEELSNKQAANMVMLGALVKVTNVVTKTALLSAVSEHISARFKDLNLKAIELGFKLAS